MTNNETIFLHLRRALEAYAKTAPDEQAATFPTLFEEWKVGEVVKPGDRRYYPPTEKLYKVNEGQGHTTQADWTPDVTPAMWSVIDVAHTGTADDPIPASRSMEYTYGLHYLDSEDGKVYLCARAGEAEGGTIVLHFMPHQLVGQYFEEVTGHA